MWTKTIDGGAVNLDRCREVNVVGSADDWRLVAVAPFDHARGEGAHAHEYVLAEGAESTCRFALTVLLAEERRVYVQGSMAALTREEAEAGL